MTRIICILLMSLLSGVLMPAKASDAAAGGQPAKAIDPKEIIFEHLGDGYGWEVPFNHHKRIPLPILVWGSDGFHCFSSSRVADGRTYKDGDAEFRIAGKDSPYKGKIVEIVDGHEEKPFDISITKNVLALFITVILVVGLMLWLARFHRRHKEFKAPRKGLGAIEAVVTFIYDGVIKSTLGPQAPRFAPYLLSVFFFILTMNLLGLIVVFPGGANLTGNIAVTLVLAVFTFLMTNLLANKHYWKEIFWPDVPAFLKAYPVAIMPVIELFGILTKPFALMIRLFANMMAGHAIILSFTAIIFIGWSLNAVLGSGLTVLSFVMMLFMNCLEFLVAFIQAYVFTMLSAVFIGLAHPEHHEG